MSSNSIGTLSSIAEVISGFAFKSSWFGCGMEKVVRISDFDNGIVTLENAVTFDAKKHPVRFFHAVFLSPDHFACRERSFLFLQEVTIYRKKHSPSSPFSGFSCDGTDANHPRLC